MQEAGRGFARGVLLLLAVLFAWALPGLAAPAEDFHVPVEYYKLPNGLRVVLSQPVWGVRFFWCLCVCFFLFFFFFFCFCHINP